jgi:hypothetical protein
MRSQGHTVDTLETKEVLERKCDIPPSETRESGK